MLKHRMEKEYQPIVYSKPSKRPLLKGLVLSLTAVTVLLLCYFSASSSEVQSTKPSPTRCNITITDFNNYSVRPTSTLENAYHKSIQLKPIAANAISRESFDTWMVEQSDLSFQRILDNIGDTNLNALHAENGVAQGAVIASPSTSHPDYFYHWIRDGAITMNSVVNNIFYTSEEQSLNLTLVGTVLKYLNNSYVLQRTDNPSGSFKRNLKGFGEPKWNVDNSAFTDPWGRPQNDGAALRVITTFNFLQVLKLADISLEEAIVSYQKTMDEDLHLVFGNEKDLFQKIIHYDLKFITENWYKDTFDLWEEIYAKHFFTSLCHLKATKMGWHYLVKLHSDFDVEGFSSVLEEEFQNMLNFILTDGGFLNANKNYVIETPSILGKRCGLDIAVLLASILTHDNHLDSSLDFGIPFDVDDSAILNTLHGLVKQMELLYPVNHQRVNLNLGVALGRYPEDEYDGLGLSEGNPWFLATSAAAEVLYKVISHYYTFGKDLVIPLDQWSSQFWSLVFEGINSPHEGPYTNDDEYMLVLPYSSPAYHQTMQNLFRLGDSFLDKLREHVSDEGEMSEQFNKYTGFLQGARHLTWSYGAFWSSSAWRNEVLKKLNEQL